ncbi:MAG: divergent polysaccharide deacetylase family protein [Synergistaceae bacterium]|nr:divergent polysaccharide deacetylase family protein [Synergistaceae bacterium]
MSRVDLKDSPSVERVLRGDDPGFLPIFISDDIPLSDDASAVSPDVPERRGGEERTSDDAAIAGLYVQEVQSGEDRTSDDTVAVSPDLSEAKREEKPASDDASTSGPGVSEGRSAEVRSPDAIEESGRLEESDGGTFDDADGRMPMLAVVVVDMGYNISLASRVISLDLPLTLAIIPGIRYSVAVAEELDRKGIPYLIHVPMQAVGDPDGKAGHKGLKDDYAIGVKMTKSEMRAVLVSLIDSMPGAYGMSNHRGSKMTSDPKAMKDLMNLLKERDIFFLDSHTTANSVAYDTARAVGVKTARNSFFLDHEAEVEKISAVFERAMKLAEQVGSAVAICHMRSETIRFLEDLKRRDMSAAGVRLVTLAELMKERELRKGDM